MKQEGCFRTAGNAAAVSGLIEAFNSNAPPESVAELKGLNIDGPVACDALKVCRKKILYFFFFLKQCFIFYSIEIYDSVARTIIRI